MVAQVKREIYPEITCCSTQNGLEEASAPVDSRMEDDEENNDGQDVKAASPRFWRASANAVEASIDLSEPKSFQKVINGPQQVH